jgi:hypothetical protein
MFVLSTEAELRLQFPLENSYQPEPKAKLLFFSRVKIAEWN